VLGWAARGLAAGATLGPMGTAVVFVRAGRSEITPPPQAGVSGMFLAGFEVGYEAAARERRRDAALVGGLVGTTVLTFAVIRVVQLHSRQYKEGTVPGPPVVVRMPVGGRSLD
jgi:Kef-type K+ transport system membrane component KefB